VIGALAKGTAAVEADRQKNESLRQLSLLPACFQRTKLA
jgi:hypothetical protein